MKSAIEKTMRYGIALSAITVVLAGAGGGLSHAQAAAVRNPCDTRDECSANPGRYGDYRDDAIVKVREYVADMNWTSGGPPDKAFVLSRVLMSTDMSGALSCNVRDDCMGRISAGKLVRVGPTAEGNAVARGVSGDRVAATPSQK